MRLLTIAMCFCALSVSANIEGYRNKGIYGDDNRVDVNKHPNKEIRELAKSVAGRVDTYELYGSAVNPDTLDFSKRTAQESMRLCSSERFKDQYVLPSCTGFLVGEDILVTAGHCMRSKYDCAHNRWVFDFTNKSESIQRKNVYKCSEIISQSAKYNIFGYAKDYAVIRLDRKVEGRKPLKFRTKGKIKKRSNVFVIGHPSGLPLKIADNAQVKNTFGLTFLTNLDTYGGNSGSPVFNLKNNVVEGILIQGDEDYILEKNCYTSNLSEKMKEKVFKINKIKELVEMKKSGEL